MSKLVYIHRRATDGVVFYVGKGRDKHRANRKSQRSEFWKSVVKKHGYTVEIIKEGLCNEEANELEIALIDFYKRREDGGSLVNHTLGGDGGLGSKYWLGKKHSNKTKSKISKSQTGNNYHLGHKHSKETKDRISKAKIGQKHSEETKFKMIKNNCKSKKVIDKSTGKTYISLRQACIELGLSYNYSNRMITGKRNRTSKFNLHYV